MLLIGLLRAFWHAIRSNANVERGKLYLFVLQIVVRLDYIQFTSDCDYVHQAD